MAQTWQGPLPKALSASETEGDFTYRLQNGEYQIKLPNHPAIGLPIEALVGGQRHGVSLLSRISDIQGLRLERPALIETRYLFGTPHGKLELSPGFPETKPSGLEIALGRALTPDFEQKCLNCHGQPQSGKTTGGVQCESCHGPGKAHVEAVSHGNSSVDYRGASESCSLCHSGFSPLADPLPEDLLISSQVTAIQQSECFRQSAGALKCTQCHDPHRDAPDVAAKSERTCAQCHATEASTSGKCLSCHMPVATRGSFQMVDHWIRVNPAGPASPHKVNPRSKLPLQHAVLRSIIVSEREKAEDLRKRVIAGESFFQLARDNSIDRTKTSGGYLGDAPVEKLGLLRDVVVVLKPGETSPVFELGGRYVFVQRFPRDFRFQAGQVFDQANQLRAKGDLPAAAQKYLEALEIYPRFLRALIFLGTTLGEQGNVDRAIATLEFAAQLYPKDAAAHYNLGIAYDAAAKPDQALAEYRRALEIEPSLTPAYQNMGADLLAAGKQAEAEEAFHKGLQQNPLSAILYYNLGLVREQRGDPKGAQAAMELARALGLTSAPQNP